MAKELGNMCMCVYKNITEECKTTSLVALASGN